MTCTHLNPRLLAALLMTGALSTLGCGDGPTPPSSTPASVLLQSPIGDRLAVGRTVQLNATARDAQGSAMSGVTFEWSSSMAAVARVDGNGLVAGVAAGSVVITASSGNVHGDVTLRVRNVNLDAISALLADAYAQALVAGLTSGEHGRVVAALARVGDGVAVGNFDTIEAGVADARAEVTGAANPTDRVLLATLALYLDHIGGLLAG